MPKFWAKVTIGRPGRQKLRLGSGVQAPLHHAKPQEAFSHFCFESNGVEFFRGVALPFGFSLYTTF